MTLHCFFRFFFVFFICCGSFASERIKTLPQMGSFISNSGFSGGVYGLDDQKISGLSMFAIQFLNQDVSVEYSQHAALISGNKDAFLRLLGRSPNKNGAEQKYQSKIKNVNRFLGYDPVVKVVNYRKGRKLYRAGLRGDSEGGFLGEVSSNSNCQVLGVSLPPEEDFNLKGGFSYKEWLNSWVQQGRGSYRSDPGGKCRVVDFSANSANGGFLDSMGFNANWNINDVSGACSPRNLGELLTDGQRECVPKRKDAVLTAFCQDSFGQGVMEVYILKGLITVGAQCK